ncbi:MAG: hypothetical protein OEW00_03865 [candidate division Zixibacteria bacterium]|nr:hypothetical protein [candidate division Zixibacteria bacterium]
MEINLLSQIRILSPSQIYPFDWPASAGSGIDLSNISQIRHPFLVTSLDSGDFLLLEEVDYFQALTESGLRHVPVQICSPDDVSIEAVRMGLINFGYDDLVRLATKYPKQIIVKGGAGGDEELAGHVSLNLEFIDSPSVVVWLRHSSRTGCPLPLDYFFRAVNQVGRYQPVVDRRKNPDSITKVASLSGFACPPPFTLDDLKAAAVSDRRFPPNVVNVRAHRRILSVDYPMAVLLSEIPVNEKEAFLKDLIALREQNRKTSFYNGQVYILNR